MDQEELEKLKKILNEGYAPKRRGATDYGYKGKKRQNTDKKIIKNLDSNKKES
ncbi:hypothetical protein [uncultured Vagococcus sp.]|uniref:hypothetical protein n=1 Tax=uncultured Vagococcus sp. TaxID=189676 RepID=UPI002587A535|nr:hypothetical protein [uncultured Vagococcus sp.]